MQDIYYFSSDIPSDESLSRVTHLGIGAHQDDLEIMCSSAIGDCLESKEKWFGGVVCTSGSGSARAGKYKDIADEEMAVIRKNEQIMAAVIGKYSVLFQLGYSSDEVKSLSEDFHNDLESIIKQTRPQTIYIHNIFDKHDTHFAVSISVLEVLANISPKFLPKQIYGVEVWRNLDWICDEKKVVLDSSKYEDLVKKQLACFDSQIAGGKRYDLATLGRMKSNATYLDSHKTDNYEYISFALDLMPIVRDHVKIDQFIEDNISCFKDDLKEKLKRISR